MRVITEKRLREWKRIAIQKGLDGIKSTELLEQIIKECKEIDHFTVTKLRPMSEAPKNEIMILAFNKYENDFVKTFFIGQDWCVPEFEFTPNEDDFIGWIPMPIYKPKDNK